jgi:hypothetical protein
MSLLIRLTSNGQFCKLIHNSDNDLTIDLIILIDLVLKTRNTDCNEIIKRSLIMSEEKQSLMWKVYHPSKPELCTYVFGTFTKLSNKNIREMAEKVVATKEFQQADMLIYERGNVIKPKSPPKDEQKKEQTTPATYPNKTNDSQSSENKCTKKHEVTIQKSLSSTLIAAARAIDKPTWPLESKHHVTLAKLKIGATAVTKPHNITKAIAVFASGPIGWATFFGLRLKKDHEDFQAATRMYLDERVNDVMEFTYPEKITRKYLVQERNQDWMTKTKLLELMKEKSLFIEVSMSHIFDKDHGLLKRFKKNGFVYEAVEGWSHEIEQESTQSHRVQFNSA